MLQNTYEALSRFVLITIMDPENVYCASLSLVLPSIFRKINTAMADQ